MCGKGSMEIIQKIRAIFNSKALGAVLRWSRGVHGRILLIEPTFTIVESEGPSEHGGEADLLNLALVGGGHRTPTELEALVQAAGLKVTSAESVGWGTVVRTLGRA